uniref:Zinc transporter ZIP11 n=1 Tax=Clastoptera arizonana TaxID=38151 RepID=A0A1B6C301_9HEMI
MLPGYGPMFQTLLGTLLTWGLTAAGAGLVIVIRGAKRKLLDTSLGFAGGVMIAASYWSLLSPALEMAAESKTYGNEGQYAFVPVALGFLLGCLFVFGTDVLISSLGLHSPEMLLALGEYDHYNKKTDDHSTVYTDRTHGYISVDTTAVDGFGDGKHSPGARRRGVQAQPAEAIYQATSDNESVTNSKQQWKRMLLLIVAITVHNIPEGLAVGVGFAAVGSSQTATFENARNLAIGIGIQNFPEGLAVSLPLQAAGFSTFKSFWYGQLSGMVEPISGLIGAAAVTLAKPLLPYALAFAAGAMIYVVFDDIIPEAQSSGNGKLSTWGAVIGFLIMMSLDVGLG